MRLYLFILTLFVLLSQSVLADSWRQAQEDQKAELDLLWYTSIPFVHYNSKQELVGLEYEIFETFEEYIREKHAIDLKLNWIQAESFRGILDTVAISTDHNLIGVSAFSITEERQQYLKFTDSYLPDITVLVSSQGTPIVRQLEDVNSLMRDMTAVTIAGTTYETFLLNMREELGMNFEIKYIHSDKNVLDHISKFDNMFAFIDLPIYLMWIKDGRDLTRQNFFTIRGIGYGFIMPLDSDWYIPFNSFLGDKDYKSKIATIISKYLGNELYQFIDNSYDREQLGTYILTKEKEIQLALIKNANLKLEEEKAYKRILILGIGVVLMFLIIIMYLFYNNQKTTKLIIKQKDQIELQQKDISQKNEQMMNRNAQLLALNEDKNNLVSILAHDLRSPLNNILGLSGIMIKDNKNLDEEQKDYLDKISLTANGMNQMITKILDPSTLEGNHKAILKEEVNIAQLMDDLSSRYLPAATNKNIELQVETPKNRLTIETDHMLLFLVLENLLSNAVKFSPQDTKVTLNVNKTDGHIIFKVSDQGPGFTDEDKSLVFQRFQKLSAEPTGNESSTGLGLSIVKKYVKDLGGKVWLESEEGNGSTFFVKLNA
ncbi:Signal transduction histidine kinase [Reichenbachiella faecimaris]|uniref:histidine kinase n=1 Tax=Reichenbachiella faecimaris TaxID=692418 RepID=A0A1W2G8M5_REIFA|nr:ATP-binding protein [Reichenbachiella faecimaris]SMD32951.1 Signal transduction histidine kinase [Reichenbachiella faecimaris]